MFKLTIKRKVIGEFATMEQAQEAFSEYRDIQSANGLRSDSVHGSTITNGKTKYKISYNSAVWDKKDNLVAKPFGIKMTTEEWLEYVK